MADSHRSATSSSKPGTHREARGIMARGIVAVVAAVADGIAVSKKIASAVPAYPGSTTPAATKDPLEDICAIGTADPSRLASLLVVTIRRVFLLLAPRQPGDSTAQITHLSSSGS
jgi:hypothetical protein